MPWGGGQRTGRDPVLAPLEVVIYVVLSGPVKFGWGCALGRQTFLPLLPCDLSHMSNIGTSFGHPPPEYWADYEVGQTTTNGVGFFSAANVQMLHHVVFKNHKFR